MLRKSLSTFIVSATIVMAAAPAISLATEGMAKSNQFWWPNTLNLDPLRAHDARSNPYGDDFNYAEAFAEVDLDELKQDIETTLTTSQD